MVKGAAVISPAPTTIPSMLSFFMIGLHDNPARQRDAFSHCSFLGDRSKSGVQFRSGSSVTRVAVSPATGKMVGDQRYGRVASVEGRTERWPAINRGTSTTAKRWRPQLQRLTVVPHRRRCNGGHFEFCADSAFGSTLAGPMSFAP